MSDIPTKKITAGLILATIVVWVGWDVFVALEPTPGDTESEIIFTWAQSHPSIPFFIGVLIGHWFWPGERIEHGRYLAWGLCGGLSVFDFLFNYFSDIGSLSMLFLLIGIVIGRICWGQELKNNT